MRQEGAVDVVHQTENRLDALFGKRLIAILDHAELGIGEHELQETFKLVDLAGLLALDELCDAGHAFFLHLP